MLYPLLVVQISYSQPKVFVWSLEYCTWEGPRISGSWEATLVAWCHNLIALDLCQHHRWQYIVNLVENC